MKFNLSKSRFKSNLGLVKNYIANISNKNLTHIEYRSCDEGVCNIDICTIPKTDVIDEFEAFIHLCNYQIHIIDDWKLTDTTLDNAGLILENFLQPEAESYLFKPLSSSNVHESVDWAIESVLELLSNNELVEKKAKYPEQWGIFKDGKRLADDTTLSDLGINNIVSGIGFNLEWNSVELMFDTEDYYVLFTWATGA